MTQFLIIRSLPTLIVLDQATALSPVLRVTNASQPMLSPPWLLPLSLIKINPDHKKNHFDT
jgi:hypothetical protein